MSRASRLGIVRVAPVASAPQTPLAHEQATRRCTRQVASRRFANQCPPLEPEAERDREQLNRPEFIGDSVS